MKHFIQTDLGKVCLHGDYDSSKETILYLHGMFLSASVWDNVIKPFPEHNNLRLDFPSHGESEIVPKDWKIEELTAVLIKVLDELKIEQKVVLCGHSLGGIVSLYFAHHHPEKLKGLVLLNTPLKRKPHWQQFILRLQLFALPLKSFFGKQAAMDLYTAESLNKNPQWREGIVSYFESRSYKDLKRLFEAVPMGEEVDALDYLNELKVPKLIVLGESESLVQQYASFNSEMLEIETKMVKGNHIAPHEASHEVITLLKGFLTGLY